MTFKIKKIIREILAIVAWLYLFTKLFIIDIDGYLFKLFSSNFQVLVYFRFIFVLVLVTILLYMFGLRKFVKNILFIIFYPIYFIIFRLSKIFLFNSIFSVIASLSVVQTLSAYKDNLLFISLFSLSTLVAFVNVGDMFKTTAIILLSILIIFYYFKKLFKPFRANEIVDKVHWKFKKNFQERAQKRQDSDYCRYDYVLLGEPEKSNLFDKHISYNVFINRVCAFITNRLSLIKNKYTIFFYMFLKMLFTFTLTCVVFSLINYLLFQINPDNYSITKQVDFIDFIFYSLSKMLVSPINYIEPSTRIATFFHLFQLFFSIILIPIILVLVYFSLRSENYEKQIHNVIYVADYIGKTIELEIIEDYQIDIKLAVDESKRVNNPITKNLIGYFDDNIK